MSGAKRTFTIRIADEDEVGLVLEFHKKYLTDFLWPRTHDEFVRLANDRSLYVAFERTRGGEDLVGLCYIMHGEEPEDPKIERLEFGGVYVTEACRGCGIATALGSIAISNQFVWDPPRGRVIAHVHENNPLPRGMLEDQLGFSHVGQEIPPPDRAPETIRRNKDGQVVGHLFEFHSTKLLDFADWIENFSGTIRGKSGESILEVELRLLGDSRSAAVLALRDLAQQRSR